MLRSLADSQLLAQQWFQQQHQQHHLLLGHRLLSAHTRVVVTGMNPAAVATEPSVSLQVDTGMRKWIPVYLLTPYFMWQAQANSAQSAPLRQSPVCTAPSKVVWGSSNPKHLTALVKRCRTWHELRKLLSAHGHCMNPIHISAVLTHCVKLNSSNPTPHAAHTASTGPVAHAQPVQRQQEGPAMRAASCLTQQHHSECATDTNSMQVWMIGVAEQLVPQLDVCLPRQLCNSLWALGKVGATPRAAFVAAALQQLQVLLPQCNPQDLSNCLWAAAALGHQPTASWLTAYWQTSQQILSRYSSQELSNTIYAAACLQALPPQAWVKQYLVHTARAWNAASTGISPRATTQDKFAPGVVPIECQQLSPQAVANTFWGLAKLQVHPGPAWLKDSMHIMLVLLPLFTSQQLSNVLWALAGFCWLPSAAWLKQFDKCVGTQLHSMSNQCLANLASSAYHLHCQQAQDRTSNDGRQCISKQSSVQQRNSVQQDQQLLQCMQDPHSHTAAQDQAVVGSRTVSNSISDDVSSTRQHLLAQLHATASARAHTLSLQDATALAWALSQHYARQSIGTVYGQAVSGSGIVPWVAGFADAYQCSLHSMHADDAMQLLWIVARCQYLPSQAWLSACCTACGQVMVSSSPGRTAQLTWAVAQLADMQHQQQQPGRSQLRHNIHQQHQQGATVQHEWNSAKGSDGPEGHGAVTPQQPALTPWHASTSHASMPSNFMSKLLEHAMSVLSHMTVDELVEAAVSISRIARWYPVPCQALSQVIVRCAAKESDMLSSQQLGLILHCIGQLSTYHHHHQHRASVHQLQQQYAAPPAHGMWNTVHATSSGADLEQVASAAWRALPSVDSTRLKCQLLVAVAEAGYCPHPAEHVAVISSTIHNTTQGDMTAADLSCILRAAKIWSCQLPDTLWQQMHAVVDTSLASSSATGVCWLLERTAALDGQIAAQLFTQKLWDLLHVKLALEDGCEIVAVLNLLKR